MTYRHSDTRRALTFESPGSVDGAFDEDMPSGQPRVQSDAACTIAWVTDGFQAIQVFVDPALVDRSGEICHVIEDIATVQRDIDGLAGNIIGWGERESLSASVIENPPDDISTGTVAVAITIG
ncbi:MAG: hypothetical protein ACJ77N_12150 [Chloroflexota bacterium]